MRNLCIFFVAFVMSVPSGAQTGDFDMDGLLGCTDVGALTSALASGSNNLLYDVDGNGAVGVGDLDSWLGLIGGLYGDVNLDTAVDGLDFLDWQMNSFQTGTEWCRGDMNADGQTDFIDFHATQHPSFGYPFIPDPNDGVRFEFDILTSTLFVDPEGSRIKLVVADTPQPEPGTSYFEGTSQFYVFPIGKVQTDPFALGVYPGATADDFGEVIWATDSAGAFFSTEVAIQYPGDANGDGITDGQDFIIWNDNKFEVGTNYAMADFNRDGITDGQDFIIWNEFKFTDWNSPNLIPEPSAMALLWLALLGIRQPLRS